MRKARVFPFAIVGALSLGVMYAPVVADAQPAIRLGVPNPTIVAGDLPGATVTDPWLDGKRDAAALSTCTSNVPLLSKLSYLNTGAEPANSRFAVRGDTFQFRIPFFNAPKVSSVVLLGDSVQQSKDAVAALGSAEFASCFGSTAPSLCAADGAQCFGVAVQGLPAPTVGDGSNTVLIRAEVIGHGGGLPLLNTVTLTIVRVGAAVGMIVTASYGDQILRDAVRRHLAMLIAQRMQGLPLGVDAPSPPLQPGQEPGGALDWAASQGALRVGTIAAWDADNGHIVGYASPASPGAPGKTFELQASGWVRLTSAHNPAVTAETLAYDDANGQLLLLGEYGGVQQTWSWDGADWTKHVGPTPGYRTGAAFTYDNAQTRLVLFGGQDRQGNELGDTWVWDGRSWLQLAGKQGPGPRDHAALAYDPATQGLVLFGGYTSGRVNTDTWLLTGSTWRKVSANRSPPSGSYWMTYMPNSGQAVLLGRDGSGTWQQWTYDEPAVTWRAVLSTGTPPLTTFWPVFDPATQQLYLLATVSGDSTWVANYYSIAAQPATPCTTYEVSDKITTSEQFLVVGGSQQKTTDISLASDGTSAVTYRQRDASGLQVNLGILFEAGIGLDASFYRQDVYDRGTGFTFTGADAQHSAAAAAYGLNHTGQPPLREKTDTAFYGGGVEIGGGISVSVGPASVGIDGAFTHIAGISVDLNSGNYSVESETEVTISPHMAFVLGWTPSLGGAQKLSEEFSPDHQPLSLTASWAGQVNSAYDLALEVSKENFLSQQQPPPASTKGLPAGAPDPKKQPESALLKQAASASLDISRSATHQRILTVQHQWALTGPGGPELLRHMDNALPWQAEWWMATNASSGTTVDLLNDVQANKTSVGGSVHFLLSAGYQHDEELVSSTLVYAAYIPPGGAPTPWVACTAGIGRP